jgi:uncharacterized membrane protein
VERSNTKSWVATLTPHRSLSRRGFITVMSLIAGVNFVTGVVFFAIGAWPIVGFCGLDVLLMWWAFRMNFADGRKLERIEITSHELILETHAEGREPQEQRFVRRWVRVEMEEDHSRELTGSLYLRSHGSRTEIGRFLSPDERKSLAHELKAALASTQI